MIKTYTLSIWKILLILAASVIFLVLALTSARAQSPSPSPATPADEFSTKHNITYPVSDLGGCTDYTTCRTYCEDPVNHNTCDNFAKQKGFYREDRLHSADDQFWQTTKDTLGCDSAESCRALCDQPANVEKCDSFAKSQGIPGGIISEPDKPEFLQIAKTVLGCDSATSCATVCDDPANQQKCTDFANQVGLLGGTTTGGPGGCTSTDTCQAYCSDPNNFSSCSGFARAGTAFTGPGGCDNPQACRSHCEQNPDDCRSYAPGASGIYVPITCPGGQFFGPGGTCTPVEKTQEAANCIQSGKYWGGNSCQDQAPLGITITTAAYFQPRPDMGGCKTAGECYDYCKDNPGKCAGFDPNAPKPSDSYTPYVYYTPGSATVKYEPKPEMGNCTTPGSCYDYCKDNPGKCSGFDPTSPRPSNIYTPGQYYTPSYYTPPPGSGYTTPTYYTPGTYHTPYYYTPTGGYTTPTYYTPGTYYTPPSYTSPTYYTPPPGYTTPTYYTPPPYYTPGSYPSPTYYTPPPGYNTPTYYTPGTYSSPSYYTPPPGYNTPTYPSPPSYGSPSYYTPGYTYPSPSYTSPAYTSPAPYGSPAYTSPAPYGSPAYTSPAPYGTPEYTSPPPYGTPSSGVGGVAGTKTRNFFQGILDFFRR